VLAGIRRLLLLVGGVSAAIAVVSLLAGAAFGGDPARALATGFYLGGTFFLLAGVAVGLRGPVRAKTGDERDAAFSLFGVGIGARGVRAATHDERREGAVLAWLFLALGLVLIVFGVLADSTVDLA
jgi:uncharacterized membrane protein HdeD (DUF308 family)